MNNGGDAAEQVVRLSLEGFEVAAKLTGSAAKNVALLLVSVLKQEQQTKGKARLTNMIKSGKELKVFSIPNKDLAQFTKQAKRYGVLYCVLRDKSAKGDDVPVDIIARAEDASKIQRIVERFEIGKVDKAGVITQAEQDKADREAVAREVPTKTKGEIIVEEAMGKPLQKEGQSHENPTVAKTEKSPPSERSSEISGTVTDRGTAKQADKKPSVREKLERYKTAAKADKEADRAEPALSKEKSKTPEPNRQTVHTQPKKHKKSKERESAMTNNFTPKKSGAAARPQLSPEEYAAKKKAEKDAVYQMIDDTATEIVSDPDKFRAYLDTQARMDRYSAANALLIYKQQPQATQLKDFRDWQEDGVKVNKGAKSLSILEPVEYTKNDGSTGIAYNVKKVFDVAQTSGKKPAAPTLDRDPRKLVAIMLDTAPIDVSTVEELPSPNMGAFYKNEDQTLYIKRDIGNSVALCQCVAQELGHAQLAMNCEAYSRRDMGFSAVCVGYMLCRKFGVDVKNFAIDRIPEELAGKSPKEIRAELSKTRSAMSEIGSRVSEEIYRRRADRNKEQER